MQDVEYKGLDDQEDSLANENSLEEKEDFQPKKRVYKRYVLSKGIDLIVV